MFVYLMIVVLVSRLAYLRDGALGPRLLTGVVVFQTIALAALTPSVPVLGYGVLTVGTSLLFHRWQRQALTTNGPRIAQLAAQIVLAVALASPAINVTFRPGLAAGPSILSRYVWAGLRLSPIDLERAGIVVLGFLMVANEANLVVRYLLERFGLVAPVVPPKPPYLIAVDGREYNAGRWIGILERLLIYVLVLNAQFAAMGFILAAKSFTRFHQLEERRFAEYVLIGTLLSSLLALLMGLAVRALVQ